jgi:hypothetical protein
MALMDLDSILTESKHKQSMSGYDPDLSYFNPISTFDKRPKFVRR